MPTTATTTANGPLMPSQRLMLMLTMDIMDMVWVTTDWVTELMDMDILMPTTATDTTARDPLMLSPRSLATPVSSEVSTAEPTLDSQLPPLWLLLRPQLLPSLSPMPLPSML